jgi:germination protein YpeB
MEKTNKIHAVVYTVLGIGIVAVLLWGFSASRSAKAYEIDVENNYNRAFHEMVGYIDDIDSLLSKAQLSRDPAELATVSSDIFRKAAGAKACMGQLPTSRINLENTAKFLSQAGDYTYVLSQDMIKGQEILQEEYDTLASLNNYAGKLKESLTEIQNKIYSGELSLTDTDAQNAVNEAQAASGDILEDLENVERAFDEYPSLIYDGPFSQHIENQQSVMLKDKTEVTRDEAQKKAEDFLGTRDMKFEYASENTAIDAYAFTKDGDNGQISVSVTKKGGYILYFINSRNIGEERYDASAATEMAMSFLERHGYENMVSSYYDKSNGVATINFAASQDGIVCYSDLIKVRVALDTGEIVGMEAKGYLMNHKQRDVASPTLSEDEARARVSTSLDVSLARMAIIPKDSLREVLCYEFKGSFNGKNFIVYINAENGHEEQILLLIEGPDGILTV